MNSGAILNRINFGLALAGGRLPGASVARWSEAERLRTAPREEQVDAVVSAFLAGQASPDTRQILLDGENPLMSKLGARAADSSRAGLDEAAMSAAPAMDAQEPMQPTPGPAKGRRRAGGGLGRPVQLNGLAQVVGLAIGAPEFQRR